ncbi:recombinase RecT, partial [Enterococcus avium]
MPIVSQVALEEFSKGQATWKNMPNTMIRKTAIVNALREAFPEALGAMYTEDDQNVKLQQTNAKQVTPEPEKTQELENKFFSNPVGGPKEADVVELENEPEQESLDLNYKDPNA